MIYCSGIYTMEAYAYNNYSTVGARVLIPYETVGNNLLCFRYSSSTNSMTHQKRKKLSEDELYCKSIYCVNTGKFYCLSMSYVSVYYERLSCISHKYFIQKCIKRNKFLHYSSLLINTSNNFESLL